MTVGQIFTKIGIFIENRHIFMLLNCNCAKVANFEDFQTCLGAFFRGHSVVVALPRLSLFQNVLFTNLDCNIFVRPTHSGCI